MELDMAKKQKIKVDLARVYDAPTGGSLITTLAWGDEITVTKTTSKHVELKLQRYTEMPDGSYQPSSVLGYIRPTKSSGIKPKDTVAAPKDVPVMHVDFADVQQGDGAVIESPEGKVVLVDGGDNQLFARYLAARYRRSTDMKPKEIDAIVVSHGDADHFAGLTKIHASETQAKPYKRLFIHPQRIYHNGLVKRPRKKTNGTRRKEIEMLGKTRKVNGRLLAVDLETDLLTVPAAKMNEPFRQWKKALKAWRKRGPIHFRRLSRGDNDAFDFLADEDIEVEVLGPVLVQAGSATGYPFLGKPKKGPRIGHESLSLTTAEFGGNSASHSINGHSIIMRLRYGNFRFMFAGDLNDQAARDLVRAHNLGDQSLRAEVFKVPHHGSADFSGAFIRAVSPVISVVSSGDESERKEYIHPRATLMGALGKYSRVEEPLIFVTELVAFFNMEGYVTPERHRMKDGLAVVENGEAVLDNKAKQRFFAFSRAAFGIVKFRTNGKRLLVYTNSGVARLKEAYAYHIGDDGMPIPQQVVHV